MSQTIWMSFIKCNKSTQVTLYKYFSQGLGGANFQQKGWVANCASGLGQTWPFPSKEGTNPVKLHGGDRRIQYFWTLTHTFERNLDIFALIVTILSPSLLKELLEYSCKGYPVAFDH